MPKHYDAVLFDFDGVIVDSEPVHFECWHEIVAEFGITLDWDVYCEKGIGVSDRSLLQFLADQCEPPVDTNVLIAQYPRKKQMFLDRMVVDQHLSPGIRDLIEDLSATYKLAVVTSSGRTEVEPLLDMMGLLQYLGTAVYGQDVRNKKPAPDPYLLAAARLNSTTALVVEDSDAGEQSGRSAGFDVLRVPAADHVARLVREALGLTRRPQISGQVAGAVAPQL